MPITTNADAPASLIVGYCEICCQDDDCAPLIIAHNGICLDCWENRPLDCWENCPQDDDDDDDCPDCNADNLQQMLPSSAAYHALERIATLCTNHAAIYRSQLED